MGAWRIWNEPHPQSWWISRPWIDRLAWSKTPSYRLGTTYRKRWVALGHLHVQFEPIEWVIYRGYKGLQIVRRGWHQSLEPLSSTRFHTLPGSWHHRIPVQFLEFQWLYSYIERLAAIPWSHNWANHQYNNVCLLSHRNEPWQLSHDWNIHSEPKLSWMFLSPKEMRDRWRSNQRILGSRLWWSILVRFWLYRRGMMTCLRLKRKGSAMAWPDAFANCNLAREVAVVLNDTYAEVAAFTSKETVVGGRSVAVWRYEIRSKRPGGDQIPWRRFQQRRQREE